MTRGAVRKGLSPVEKRVRVRPGWCPSPESRLPTATVIAPLHPTKLSPLGVFAHTLLHCLQVLLFTNTSSHCQGYALSGFLQEVFPDDPRMGVRALAVSTNTLAWVTNCHWSPQAVLNPRSPFCTWWPKGCVRAFIPLLTPSHSSHHPETQSPCPSSSASATRPSLIHTPLHPDLPSFLTNSPSLPHGLRSPVLST